MLNYFMGWYMKCQSDTQSFAVIPAVHRAGRRCTCSVQMITDDGAWTVTFPGRTFRRTKRRIEIGECIFDEKGMRYSVNGTVFVNGQRYSFRNACGYWEGDRGRSFPKEYLWTQCSFREGALMLSVADIPIAGIHFTGIIGAVWWRGREYRLATYLGARVVAQHDRRVCIRQGDLELEAQLLETKERTLSAPKQGAMVRTIRESVACRAGYRFRKRGRTLFSFVSDRVSFEYEYPS